MYRHPAVAANFSPTLLPVLAEAAHLAKTLDAPLSLIHGAEADMEKAHRFQDALEEVGWEGATEILWTEAATPMAAILQAAEDSAVDLLIAGAIEQESEHRHFLGSVAQGLMRRSKCDVLLLPKPSFPVKPLRTVVVAAEFTAHNNQHFDKVIAHAEKFGAGEIIILGVYTPFVRSKLQLGSKSDASQLIETMAKELGEKTKVAVDWHVTESNTGFSACDYVQELGRSVLAVQGTQGKDGLVLPPQMDWLYQVLPTNTWIISNPE